MMNCIETVLEIPFAFYSYKVSCAATCLSWELTIYSLSNNVTARHLRWFHCCNTSRDLLTDSFVCGEVHQKVITKA